MVIRGYLAGHAAREYAAGKRMICGVEMPENMKENDPFPQPIITPATKADEGHDEDISREAILEKNIEPYDVYTADEAFMTGTPFCMLPVTTLNGLPIGDGKVGHVFNSILSQWSKNTEVNIAEQIKTWNKIDGEYLSVC